MKPVRLEPATFRSQDKHSTTALLTNGSESTKHTTMLKEDHQFSAATSLVSLISLRF